MSNALSDFLKSVLGWRVEIVLGLLVLALTGAGIVLGAPVTGLGVFNIAVGVLAVSMGVYDYRSELTDAQSKMPEGQR